MAPAMVFVAILTPWNAARGQMAEAFLRYYAGDDLHVYSGGTAPAGLMRPEALQVMYERGIAIPPGLLPKLMLSEYLRAADYIIYMGALAKNAIPKDVPGKVIEWKIEDPLGTEIERWAMVRDRIEENVVNFLKDLKAQGIMGKRRR
jgi:protein-tyrosine-phosphatase